MDVSASSLDGGWLCDIPVTVPTGELVQIALTSQDEHVRDLKQLLLAQHAERQALPVAAVRLVECAAHDGSRITGDAVDRELHDAMGVIELAQRVQDGALLRLHVSSPHCWSSSEGAPWPCPSPDFAQQPPPSGRGYVCVSNTGKANVRPTASLTGRLLREINPGDTVAVFEEKICEGHLRGRISEESDETSGEAEWLSIRTRFGNPLMQAASLEEQAAALEAATLSPGSYGVNAALSDDSLSVAEPQRAEGGAGAASVGVDLEEFELDFGDVDLG